MTEKTCVLGSWLKRLCPLAGCFLIMISAAWVGVGPGMASELPVTSPLMGNGGAVPQLTFPSPQAVHAPVYTPALRQQPGPAMLFPGPASLHVVSPLPR